MLDAVFTNGIIPSGSPSIAITASKVLKGGITIDKIEVGQVNRIFRYPVKALAGEELACCPIEKTGLYGDRSHAFVYAERPDKFVASVRHPQLLSYQAKFSGCGSVDRYPDVTFHSKTGAPWRWGEQKELMEELRSLTGQPMLPIQYSPNDSARAYWEDAVLITTDASLERLEQMHGARLDIRRFRPNIHIALKERVPFSENGWIGKKLMIASAELKPNKSCIRCGYIDIDPESMETDASIRKTVTRELNNRFGLYASVVQTGSIRVNDKVYLID